VLRRLLRSKRADVTDEWRRLHENKLYDPYFSPNIIRVTKSRRMRGVVHVARRGDKRDAYRVLVRRPEGKRLLVRSRRRREDNIKKEL
jgi:hypothetical protein